MVDANEEMPPCPVCGSAMRYDPEDRRVECQGYGGHCYQITGEGPSRELMLTASNSGEDADLFSTYPWPEGS